MGIERIREQFSLLLFCVCFFFIDKKRSQEPSSKSCFANFITDIKRPYNTICTGYKLLSTLLFSILKQLQSEDQGCQNKIYFFYLAQLWCQDILFRYDDKPAEDQGNIPSRQSFMLSSSSSVLRSLAEIKALFPVNTRERKFKFIANILMLGQSFRVKGQIIKQANNKDVKHVKCDVIIMLKR